MALVKLDGLPELPQGVVLSEREHKAYAYWCASKEPSIAPSTSAQFFQLFLQGKSCEQIRQINPGFQLGAIVAARINGKWDEEAAVHLKDLLGKARQRIQQTTLETVDLFCDLLTAKNKLYREKVMKFIQTGNEKEIEGLDLYGVKGYKEVIESLLKVTGQDSKKVSGNVTVTVEPPAAAAPVTSETAAAILSALKVAKDEKKE